MLLVQVLVNSDAADGLQHRADFSATRGACIKLYFSGKKQLTMEDVQNVVQVFETNEEVLTKRLRFLRLDQYP